jgi:hypothetical protein
MNKTWNYIGLALYMIAGEQGCFSAHFWISKFHALKHIHYQSLRCRWTEPRTVLRVLNTRNKHASPLHSLYSSQNICYTLLLYILHHKGHTRPSCYSIMNNPTIFKFLSCVTITAVSIPDIRPLDNRRINHIRYSTRFLTTPLPCYFPFSISNRIVKCIYLYMLLVIREEVCFD